MMTVGGFLPGSVATTTDWATPVARTSASSLRVVGLGDSVVAGTGCDCGTFVSRYAQILHQHTGRKVVARVDGFAGLTSADVRAQLESRTAVADDVRGAGVILITVGANDLGEALRTWRQGSCDEACSTAALPDLERNIERIGTDVRRLRAGQPTTVVVTDYWNLFQDGKVARSRYGDDYLAWSDHLTRVANQAICAAARRAAATCVDLYAPFKGDGSVDPSPDLAVDGDHPNAQGHALIAGAIARTAPQGVVAGAG